MRGRPLLYTQYEDEQSMLPTTTQKVLVGLLLFVAILIPLGGLRLWFLDFGFFGDSDWLIIINRALVFGVAALGLNLLTGVAGQVSLGHAFFMAVGAYTAVVLGGESGRTIWGLGLPIWIWLPAAGLVAALVGILVAPAAVKVRGLYLGIVTLGLVFVGLHLWRNWGKIAGGPTTGRDWPDLEFSFWRVTGDSEPIISLARDGPSWFFIDWLDWLFGPLLNFPNEMSSEAKAFFFLLAVLVAATIVAKNLARTRIGRSFAAVRDRDIAAAIMGVGEFRAKLQAFATSSFFAGVGGALFAVVVGRLIPQSWDLLLSVEFIAIILIGGAGTVAGTLMGTFFVVMLPRFVEEFTIFLSDQATDGGAFSSLAKVVIAEGSDFCCISTSAAGPGLSVFQFNLAVFGVLIVVFLIAEPLGLYGVWIRIRNYWKGWPFTY